MANITELQLQGDSTVHKLNDARIATSAVSTATHFLATDSSISSIAPITAANLASVLGVPKTGGTISPGDDFNNYVDSGVWGYNAAGQTPAANSPGSTYQIGSLTVFHPVGTSAAGGNPVVQIYVHYDCSVAFMRTKWVNVWSDWREVAFV